MITPGHNRLNEIYFKSLYFKEITKSAVYYAKNRWMIFDKSFVHLIIKYKAFIAIPLLLFFQFSLYDFNYYEYTANFGDYSYNASK